MKKIAMDTARNYVKEKKPAGVVKTSMVFASGAEVEVEIRTSLTTEEKSTFINRVLSGCFDGNGDYRPEYLTPMLRATILQMCTNLPVISLKGEKTDNGESVMDIDAMDALYSALDLDALDDAGYQSLMGEMVHQCAVATDWRKARNLSGANTALADAAKSVRELAAALMTKLDGFDLEALTEYAAKLSKATDGMDEGQIVNALIKENTERAE